MKPYLEKFNKLFKGKKSINIVIFSENPLTTKLVRFNQGGKVCSCAEGSNIAFQKAKNGWEQKECTPQCQYRQKNEKGKTACNRIGWLKFLIPSICTDRIFLMRITGQKSINRLEDYFSLQQIQGHSLKGKYTLFLKQEEQSNYFAQTFNNYVLDILKNENLESKKPLPKEHQNNDTLNETNNNVNSSAIKQDSATSKNIVSTPLSNTELSSKQIQNKKLQDAKKVTTNENKEETVKKTTKSKSKKTDGQKESKPTEISSSKENNESFDNCYALINTSTQTLVDKQGNSKEYLVGEFADMNDKISNIIIKPEDADELSACDLGTMVKLDVKEVGDKKFAIKLDYVSKLVKNIAA